MALNIKNRRTEELASEVAEITGETKTEAIRRALEARREQLRVRSPKLSRVARLRTVLENEIWPNLPPGARGKPIGKAEREAILGYGENGV
jgi:antitoxin VapB